MDEVRKKLDLAEKFENENKLLHALQIYKSLAEGEEPSVIALMRLALLYEKMGRTELGAQTLEKFLENYPDEARVRRFYLQYLIKQQKYQEAIEAANLISKEDDPTVYTLVGLAYYYLNEYKIAKINFEEYINSNDKSLLPEAYFYIASCNFKMAELDEALKYIKKSEKLFGLNPELYLVKGMTYYAKKMYFHAFDALQQAELLDKGNFLIKELKAKVLFELGDYAKAKKVLYEILESGKENAEYFTLLGLVNLRLENKQEARKYFKKALVLNPEDNQAKEGLQKCRKRKNENQGPTS